MILTIAVSGKEFQVEPNSKFTSDEYDQMKREVIQKKRSSLRYVPYRPSIFVHDNKGHNAVENIDSPQALWGISQDEETRLINIGDELMVLYYRSRARQK